jgi:hypothetical protein
MTLNNITEYFSGDTELLNFFDPASSASTVEEAANEVYHKLIEFSRTDKCSFARNEMGYVFYCKHKKILLSFCVKPAYRNKENLEKFGEFIKEKLGNHFGCYLYNRNTRAIGFLKKMGMYEIDSNDLITLLYI